MRLTAGSKDTGRPRKYTKQETKDFEARLAGMPIELRYDPDGIFTSGARFESTAFTWNTRGLESSISDWLDTGSVILDHRSGKRWMVVDDDGTTRFTLVKPYMPGDHVIFLCGYGSAHAGTKALVSRVGAGAMTVTYRDLSGKTREIEVPPVSSVFEAYGVQIRDEIDVEGTDDGKVLRVGARVSLTKVTRARIKRANDGTVISLWRAKFGTTGTVLQRVTVGKKSRKTVYRVAPDAPNYGVFTFYRQEIEPIFQEGK